MEDIEQFWIKLKTTFPYLSNFALTMLKIPYSQAAVERSFSIYRKILIPSRHNLLKENLSAFLMLYFNNRADEDNNS